MRKVLSGSGADTTSAVQQFLAANRQFYQANLYLIGEPEDPFAQWLTDWEAPLSYPLWSQASPTGFFNPGVISRSTISSKVGLEVTGTDIIWRPKNQTLTSSNASASPLQLAQTPFYDNWRVRIWRTIMPTPGDANTFGAYELFGGYVAACDVDRQQIKMSVNSLLYVVNEKVPTNIIELTSTLSGFTGATPPPPLTVIPKFNVIVGSTPTMLILDAVYPTPGQIFADGLFQRGFVAFNAGAGATLEGAWSIIRDNGLLTIGGINHNVVYLYNALSWAPTPGVDTCIISGAAPINQADGDYEGFPYVPNPQQAVGGIGVND